ncbi:MAG TPA: HD domain-containing protein [Anaerolineales bacterium]|nr:HD domain-containing protein [Anaerolineales bacterium]
MNHPTLQQAQTYLREAETLNPGPWVAHSIHVAEAARIIAERHPDLDPDTAYILGLLHDIGRREGVKGMIHVLDGYRFLTERGHPHAARICLTHSYPVKDAHSGSSDWDGTKEEFQFVVDYLSGIEYDEYDRLYQVCDALALPQGFCLLEKRWVDVLMRYKAFTEFTLPKWQATADLKRHFDKVIGQNLYTLLPGIAETTFGF